MAKYLVETLVHLNKDIPVEADDPDEAVEKARVIAAVMFPDAALVDPTNWACLDAGETLR